MDRFTKRLIVAAVIILVLTSVIWIPAMVYAATGNTEKLQLYVKAVEYGLKGLQAYFQFIIELFKTAVTTP